MTRFCFRLVLAFVTMAAPCAMAQAPSPPYEIVKQSTDLEVAPDGRTWEASESRTRPLTAAGVQALQQITLSYTADYQDLNIFAYTLKQDGRRIDVPQGDMLQGHGDTSAPGFQDTRTLTVVFPNLEIGDQAVVAVNSRQLKPWFENVFASTQLYGRDVVVREATYAFTTRGNDSAYRITASDVQADPPVTLAGKTRHVWHFHNDQPVQPESAALSEVSYYPHVEITNLADYKAVAKIYADLFRDKVAVTPDIAAQAAKIVAGITDRRARARAIYEWVSSHVQYVSIVLGAGGFVPHNAKDVLANGYGDCKDHVMLLEALLAAQGIKSSPVLIRAGAAQFRLPGAASPFLFDHLITYIPEFALYLDSTARYAPFGVLPGSDAGREVVIVASGQTAVTPQITAANSGLAAQTSLKINDDGSADGDTRLHAKGDAAVSLRALMAAMPLDKDALFFRAVLGAGSDGKLQRGNPEALDGDGYGISAHYHIAHAAIVPGPGAVAANPGWRSFSFAALVGDVPPERTRDYVCGSGLYEETQTVTFSNGVTVSALPQGRSFDAPGIAFRTDYQQQAPGMVRASTQLRLDPSGPVCRAADYAALRPALSGITGALLAQILYK